MCRVKFSGLRVVHSRKVGQALTRLVDLVALSRISSSSGSSLRPSFH